MYVCMHACMHACMYVCTYVRVCVYACTCSYAQLPKGIHRCVHQDVHALTLTFPAWLLMQESLEECQGQRSRPRSRRDADMPKSAYQIVSETSALTLSSTGKVGQCLQSHATRPLYAPRRPRYLTIK